MWAIVPLKYFDDAKSRLADVLSATERQLLVRTMARDVLRALSGCSMLQGVLINSRESEVFSLAQEFSAEVFIEPSGCDLSRSVTLASEWLERERGANGTLIVHADIPLATSADFNTLLQNHQQLSFVPDDEEQGTNCIAATPPNPIDYRYDGKSFAPHLAAAESLGLTSQVCRIERLQLDIDTRADLEKLLIAVNSARAAGEPIGETGTYLEASGIAQRLGTPYSG